MINLLGTTNVKKLVEQKKTDRIIKLLSRADIKVQMDALWGIEELLAVEAIPQLWNMAQHYQSYSDKVREKAIEVIFFITYHPGVTGKIKNYKDNEFLIKTQALSILWGMTTDTSDKETATRATKAILYLIRQANEPDLTRETFHRFLKLIATSSCYTINFLDELMPFLEFFKKYLNLKTEFDDILNGKDEKMQKVCLEFILQTQDMSFAPLLIKALHNENWWTRRGAIWALKVINNEQSEQKLLNHLETLIPHTYSSNAQTEIEDCIHTLSALKSTLAVPVIILLLNTKYDSANNQIRKAAIEALSAIGGKQAHEAILDCELYYYFEWIDAVRKIGDRRAVEELKKGLEYPNEGIRRRSAEALRHIEGSNSVSLEFIAEKFNSECKKIVGDIEYVNKHFWQFGVGPSGKTPIPSEYEITEKAKRNIQSIYQFNDQDWLKIRAIARRL